MSTRPRTQDLESHPPVDLPKLGHDLNNVLMTIGSATFVLGEKLRGTTQDEGEIGEIEAALERATELVRQLRSAQPALAPTPRPQPVSGTPASVVLLVEDELTVRRVIRRVLETIGFEVLEANDGKAAMEIAEQELGRVSLLLTDVMMPEIGGPELASKLLLLRPELKVIYMTGYLGEVERRGGLMPKGAALLTKPFTPGALITCVRETLTAGNTPALSFV